MGKTNKLTIYIFAAMILGVITGYVFNRFGGGHQISYTAKADFTGNDTVQLQTSNGLTLLPLFIAKDSADLKNAKTIFPATQLVLGGKSITLTTKDRIETIESNPKNGTAEITAQKSFADYIKLLSTIFIRLVQMIISPLVFTTLVVGIAKLGDVKTVGRVGGKAILWFITASITSLLIGLLLVNFFQPGQYISLSQADISGVQLLREGGQKAFTAQNFIEHVVPKSFIEAMANNEMLQLVIFSVFFGIAASAIGDYSKPLIKGLEIASHIILKMVNYVMNFAPLGVFGAIAAIVATKGLGIFNFYFKYFSFFLLGIACLWAVLLLAGFLILGRRLPQLLKRIGSPMLVAFSTTSSEAVFPKLTEELERFGCKDRIVSFVLPLGYSFNLDGSMMYMTFASLAIAQAYHVDLSIGTQLTMLLVLMLTSKGIAGVPRASLVVVLATCVMFNIPAIGIALILPIDHFCDMFRTMTNVLGNALATSVVSKWEGELAAPE